MKVQALILCSLLSICAYGQSLDGKSVIEFNASFNTQNGYKDLGRLSGAKLYRMNVEAKPEVMKKYNIKSVPTLILFRDGKEVWRWEAGIDMKLHVHYMEIQESINRF